LGFVAVPGIFLSPDEGVEHRLVLDPDQTEIEVFLLQSRESNANFFEPQFPRGQEPSLPSVFVSTRMGLLKPNSAMLAAI